MRKSVIFFCIAVVSASAFSQANSISKIDKEAIDKLFIKEKNFYSCSVISSNTRAISDNKLTKNSIDKKNVVSKFHEKYSDEFFSKVKKQVGVKITENAEPYKYAGKKSSELYTELVRTYGDFMQKNREHFKEKVKDFSEDDLLVFIGYELFMKNNCGAI